MAALMAFMAMARWDHPSEEDLIKELASRTEKGQEVDLFLKPLVD
jgi:hypothetical protein